MLSRADTQQYPEVRPDLPPRSRGVIALVEENCTVCMLCARECPDWCIYIDSHKETTPAPEGGRPRAHNVLDRFAIDFSLCMYCGICIEVCPFDALFWSPEFEYAEGDIRNLLHEKDRLGEWVRSVPVPPPHEPNAEPPKEVAGAARPARERPAARQTAPDRPATTPPNTPGETAGTPGETPGTPAPGTPETRPGTPSGQQGGHAAVRAIRPPGALPKKPAAPPATPPSSTEEPPFAGPSSSDGPPEGERPKRGPEEPPERPGTVEES
ncbi:4Fe-4S binding protein [Sphaerisporangium corydalis]|uniref:4Fe-4S binding protein n=1 Tax=Sphaerisporangium corydalis TaxID=1441875 RepID=A0ABV9EHF1_9ACTN|nr:4Fe-4S binding protein [Sphaerisporangium corydalis]